MIGKMNKKLFYSLFLILVLALSFLLRFSSFSRTPYAVGRDAYFHIIQARSFLEDGKTHAPDSSFTPYVLAYTYLLTQDWEQAQKLLASALTALLGLFSYLAALKLFRKKQEDERVKWALLLAFLTSVSPTLTHISAQYLKQLFGMVSFSIFLWSMLWNIEQDESHKDTQEAFMQQVLRRSLMFGAVILAVFSHRLSGGMALLGLVFALPWLWSLFGVLLGIVILILGSIAVPGILSVFDLERFSGLLSWIPSFHPLSVSRLLRVNTGWMLEVILPYVVSLGIFFRWFKNKEIKLDRVQWYIFVLLMLLLFPFYNMKELDFGFRIFIAVIPFLPFLYLSLLSDSQIRFGALLSEKYRQYAVLVISLFFLPFSYLTFDPQHMLPYEQYKEVIHKAEKILTQVEPEIVILHHGFSFFYTYESYRHTLPFVPDWEVKNTDVYRIAFNIPDNSLKMYLIGVKPGPIRLSEDYILIREDMWQTMLQVSSNDKMMQFRMQNPMNPYQKRPSFLARHQDHVTETE